MFPGTRSARAVAYSVGLGKAACYLPRSSEQGELWIHDGEDAVSLGRVEADQILESPKIVPSRWAVSGDIVIDLEREKMFSIEPPRVAACGDSVLVVRDGNLVLLDTTSGTNRELGVAPGRRGDLTVGGPYVAWGGRVFDLRSPGSPRDYEGWALAISPSGALLTVTECREDYCVGPLRWAPGDR